jgi:hypothetical protein
VYLHIVKINKSLKKKKREAGVAGQWWRMPLIPALGRQRQADL